MADHDELIDRVSALETKAAETGITLKFVAETLKRLETLVCQIATDLNNWVKVQVNEAKSEREEHRADTRVATTEMRAEFNDKMMVMDRFYNTQLATAAKAMKDELKKVVDGERQRITQWVSITAIVSALLGALLVVLVKGG